MQPPALDVPVRGGHRVESEELDELGEKVLAARNDVVGVVGEALFHAVYVGPVRSGELGGLVGVGGVGEVLVTFDESLVGLLLSNGEGDGVLPGRHVNGHDVLHAEDEPQQPLVPKALPLDIVERYGEGVAARAPGRKSAKPVKLQPLVAGGLVGDVGEVLPQQRFERRQGALEAVDVAAVAEVRVEAQSHAEAEEVEVVPPEVGRQVEEEGVREGLEVEDVNLLGRLLNLVCEVCRF
ncbi:coenzyme A transferase [Babesia caballi]|uniref:Coenzyme A transferase n=1 Tax=Babesia caballi TaxID=5871 RepID=A0AAV4LP54_BABCB|nr:coenzyme A transferase [Babesia caballi]